MAFRIRIERALNQVLMIRIQLVKVLNQLLKVLIQAVKELIQEPNRPIQPRP